MFDSAKINISTGRRYINDICLLAAFLCVGAALFCVIPRLLKDYDSVSVHVKADAHMGNSYASGTVYDFPLSDEGYIPVITADGLIASYEGSDGTVVYGISDSVFGSTEDAVAFIRDFIEHTADPVDIDINPDRERIVFDVPGYNLNIICIKDHSAGMLYSDCPDQICVHMPDTGSAAIPIVCLPHGIGIYMGNDESVDDTDAVTW